VGFIPLAKNTRASEAIQIRRAPFDVPDPLLDARSMNLPANSTQPVWLTVFVPKDAAPGEYRGEAAVIAGQARSVLPVELTVDPFTLPDERHVLVTNWFNTDVLSTQYGLESEEYWAMLQRLAEMMADHHQNVVLTPLSLVQVYLGTDDEYMYDFSKFDRWVNLFDDAGVDAMIELGHVGSRATGEWECPEFVFHSRPATRVSDGSATTVPVTEFVRAVQDHLRERGWLDRSALHIAD